MLTEIIDIIRVADGILALVFLVVGLISIFNYFREKERLWQKERQEKDERVANIAKKSAEAQQEVAVSNEKLASSIDKLSIYIEASLREIKK